MNRQDFLKSLSLLALSGAVSKVNAMNFFLNDAPTTERTPLLFIGHGSPFKGINDNPYSQTWKDLGKQLETPAAVLVISAHWQTKGIFVTGLPENETIHTFNNFPKELFDVRYPAPGKPELAKEVQQLITTAPIEISHDWGLDHGAWIVLRRLFPKADIPVIQLSVDYSKSATYHYELGKQLAKLRRKGVLIIGSGNIIHNLNTIKTDSAPFDWALEAQAKFNQYILDGNHQPLLKYQSLGSYATNAVPAPDHYFPLAYVLGLQEKDEQVRIFNDEIIAGSLSMTSLHIQK